MTKRIFWLIVLLTFLASPCYSAVEDYEQELIEEPEEAKEGEKQEPVNVNAINEEIRKLHAKVNTDFWELDGGDIKLKTADDIDIQQKQMKQMRIENRTADPSSPETGEIWLRTDL